MFRDEIEAAMARAAEAERRVAELEARDRSRAAELDAARAELEALRAAAEAPAKRERRIGRSLIAALVLLETCYAAACIVIAMTYSDSSARWYGLLDDAFHARVPLAIRGASVAAGLALMIALLPMAYNAIERLPEDPEHPKPSSRPLVIWAMISGPVFFLVMPWYLIRLGRCDGDDAKRFDALMTVLALGLHSLFFLPATIILFPNAG